MKRDKPGFGQTQATARRESAAKRRRRRVRMWVIQNNSETMTSDLPFSVNLSMDNSTKPAKRVSTDPLVGRAPALFPLRKTAIEEAMRTRWFTSLIAVVALTAVGACSLPAPYVYQVDEFNRESKDFGKDLKDRTSVGICYNKKNTTPKQIVKLAQDECAKYHKTARFSEQKRLECPIITPMEAIFECVPQARYGTPLPYRY
jgi:hypothetical protein